ncbi:MAG: tetratricopeptide repeat protein [Chlamydiales bacterium]|nr:tetratricopeptide repeat protein [Chlamydiales bacterium]
MFVLMVHIRTLLFFFCCLFPSLSAGTFPLLEGFSAYSSPLGPKTQRAQAYFNQGMVLYYGFNYLEAARSFEEAAKLEPTCAMCYWGEAAAYDQSTSSPEDKWFVQGKEAILKAERLIRNSTPEQKGLILALSKKFRAVDAGNDLAVDKYIAALKKLSEKYPNAPDIRTLYIQAFMDKNDLMHGMHEGRPTGVTKEILDTLQTGLTLSPKHVGLLHFNIHALEACNMPEQALSSATALDGLVPGSGHLQHMPAHIYFALGRYHEATEANQRGVAADAKLLNSAAIRESDFAGFYLHNYYYLFGSLVMEGRLNDAMEAANDLIKRLNNGDMMTDRYITDTFTAVPYLLLARFGKWDEILQINPPPAQRGYVFSRSVYAYAVGLAFAHTGQPEKAKKYLKSLKDRIRFHNLDERNVRIKMLGMAFLDLQAQLETDPNQAVAALRKAVMIEDNTNLDMTVWYLPMRLSLGAALLKAGKPQQAEKVYLEDLKKHPENGWALSGLMQSLQAQHKDVGDLPQRIQKAWQHADPDLKR